VLRKLPLSVLQPVRIVISPFTNSRRVSDHVAKKNLVDQYIYQDWQYHLKLFTDAAINKHKNVGISVCIPDLKIVKTYRVLTLCSIFTAELVGVLMAFRLLLDLRPLRAMICCDSLSVVRSLGSGSIENPIIDEIIHTNTELIQYLGLDINLVWIPAHIGVYGNERADFYAKQALQLPPRNIITTDHTLDEMKEVHPQIDNLWQERWNSSKKGRFTYSIVPDVNNVIMHKNLTRRH
jgi:ribonuclease HI